jgi:hypothetical protein
VFRSIAGTIPGGADALFRLHPAQLALLLEQAWELRTHDTAKSLGDPDHRSDLPGLPGLAGGGGLGPFVAAAARGLVRATRYDHLIYAYMIENTRVLENFEQVVREFVHGEEVGVPIAGAEHWLRNTEELFFNEPSPFSITRVFSQIRGDLRATRRNAYQRLFGMDLNHGVEDKREYPYVKARASNAAFVGAFEELLREVWVGVSNVNNQTGVNPTDVATIADLARRLHDMLISRREGGNLSREEFYAVSTLSWFHLTVEFDSPIVVSLRANGTSPDERLFKVGERVRSRVHARSRSFFELADPMSRVLIEIEKGQLGTPAAARAFFDPALNNVLPADMNTIIAHWPNVTGHDMKMRKTLVSA